MDRTVLCVNNLSFAYPGGKETLHNLSFTLREGERAALLGANGSGKSTLICCLNGLLAPARGGVTVFDAGGRALNPADQKDLVNVRRRAGTVLQTPDDQIFGSAVEEDVAFGPENLGLGADEIRRRVDQAIARCGLEKLRNRSPHSLSGGEKQRLALAGVLALDSGVIILDEAVSMLDPSGRRHFLALLDELSAAGKTILEVTHSLEDAFRCGRCLVLHRGCLVFDGEPAALIEKDELEAWGFILPESIRAIRLLKERFPGFSVSTPDAGETAERIVKYMKGARRTRENPRCACSPLPPNTDAPSVPVVCFDNASHEYFAGTAFAVPAMRNVSFRLAAPSGRGVTLALIGTSGSGKSTLLKHSNALLFPAKGRVAVLGKDTLDKKTRLTGLRMNAVLSAQSPESALFEEFVADDVAFGPANAGLAGEALKARVRAAMEETALPFAEFADRKTRSLSGGEKRLAAVAGAAAMDSPLLLLDEPLAALDGAHQKKITALIQSRRERGKTVIAAIHSMETAASFDLIGVMVDGTLAAFGPPEEIFGPLWNPAWGLELPWTAAVARRLADAGALSGGAAPLDAEELLYCIENGAAPERSAARRHADAAAAGRDCADTPPDRRRTNRRRTTAPGFFRAAPYRFQDRPSPLRSLSGGVKLALLLAGMAAAVALPAFPLPGLSPLESAPLPVFPAALLLLTLAAGAAAGGTGPAHLLRGLCPLAPWLLVIIVLQCLYGGADDSSRVLLSVWKAPVTVDKLVHAVSVVVRAASLIALFTLYSAVTPLRDTLNAFRAGAALLAPSKETARDISMAAGIALRFIPVLTEEAERIVTAQLSRGGKKGRLRMIFSMIVPLFLRALERAEKLAHAMTLRLYGTLRPSA